MRDDRDVEPQVGAELTRRGWLAGSLLAGWAIIARNGVASDGKGSSATEIAEIRKKAKASGLGAFPSTETEHYLGIGDAPDLYRENALKICQRLSDAYGKHLREKGFTVEFPERRLTVVTLKDKASYEKFLGEAPGAEVGGHYDLEGNRLVIFDFRPPVGEPVANAERVNLFTLIHEGIHQLTFNTGLLSLKADVPLCVSEGLATYGESWRPGSRTDFGRGNMFRADVLAKADDWIAVDDLFNGDKLFELAEKEQLAYAQSWALITYLLKSRLPKFREYLAAIRDRRGPEDRTADVEKFFGNLVRLNRDVRKHASRLIRS